MILLQLLKQDALLSISALIGIETNSPPFSKQKVDIHWLAIISFKTIQCKLNSIYKIICVFEPNQNADYF